MPKKKSKSFARLSTVPMLHWTTRATKGDTELPVHTRSIKVTAETFEECSQLSMVVDLMTGEAPPALQKAFQAECDKNSEKFNKEIPDYEYRVGGRVPATT